MGLACWEAAKRIQGSSGALPEVPSHGSETPARRVLFVWEHPADPETYMPERLMFEITEARFDQGCEVIQAWVCWGREQGLWQDVHERKVWLAKTKEHRRAAKTGVYSASFDLAGPFIPGRSYDPAASGRDRGLGYKYFLACAFTVPLKVGEWRYRALVDDPPKKAVEPPVVDTETGEPLDIPSLEELFGPGLEQALQTQAAPTAAVGLEADLARQVSVEHNRIGRHTRSSSVVHGSGKSYGLHTCVLSWDKWGIPKG